MHVVMIICKYSPFIGGAEKQAERMAKTMVKKGHKVTILTRRYKGLAKKEFRQGIQINRLPFLPWGILAPLTFMLFCLIYIYKFKNRISLIHAHQHDSSFTAAVAKILTGIPAIAHFHGGSHDQGSEVVMLARGRKGKLMLKTVRRKIDAYIAVSEGILQDLKQVGIKQNVYVIPNGVDVEKYCPASKAKKTKLRKVLNLPLNSVIFVFSGRLEPVKGIDLLIKAWLKLSDKVSKEATLVILGEGSQAEKVYEKIKSCPNCKLRGAVSNVSEYLRSSDVFVMPSRYEGTSLSILEAMACGLPILVTNVGGNVDLIKHRENGILIPATNTECLIKSLEELYFNLKLRNNLGAKARATVLEKYSFEGIISKYEKLCESIVGNKLKL